MANPERLLPTWASRAARKYVFLRLLVDIKGGFVQNSHIHCVLSGCYQSLGLCWQLCFIWDSGRFTLQQVGSTTAHWLPLLPRQEGPGFKHVLPAWVFSRYFGFLLQSKDMTVRSTGHSKLSVGVNVSINGCLFLYICPVMNRQLVHGVTCRILDVSWDQLLTSCWRPQNE